MIVSYSSSFSIAMVCFHALLFVFKSLFQSLSALLKTAVHDKDDVVRQTAQKVLNKHPKSGNITREQENIVLR